MVYRILADENIERATVNYLRKLGHDVERLDDVTELGLVPKTSRSPGTPTNTSG
ncbi:hypothetical protein [Halovenus marina]|uniref:hypothetical protein n=1 Tax=Halovenus marina TaxID=3396621 RepID=UPI003F542779